MIKLIFVACSYALTKREKGKKNINRNEHLSYLNNHNALNDTLGRSLCSRSVLQALFAFYENDMKKRDGYVCACNRFSLSLSPIRTFLDASICTWLWYPPRGYSLLCVDSSTRGIQRRIAVPLWWKGKLSG